MARCHVWLAAQLSWAAAFFLMSSWPDRACAERPDNSLHESPSTVLLQVQHSGGMTVRQHSQTHASPASGDAAKVGAQPALQNTSGAAPHKWFANVDAWKDRFNDKAEAWRQKVNALNTPAYDAISKSSDYTKRPVEMYQHMDKIFGTQVNGLRAAAQADYTKANKEIADLLEPANTLAAKAASVAPTLTDSFPQSSGTHDNGFGNWKLPPSQEEYDQLRKDKESAQKENERLQQELDKLKAGPSQAAPPQVAPSPPKVPKMMLLARKLVMANKFKRALGGGQKVDAAREALMESANKNTASEDDEAKAASEESTAASGPSERSDAASGTPDAGTDSNDDHRSDP